LRGGDKERKSAKSEDEKESLLAPEPEVDEPI